MEGAYSPSIGRWLNRDPIGEDGGVNLYAYVFNSPTNRSDASGLCPLFAPLRPDRIPPPPCNESNKLCYCPTVCQGNPNYKLCVLECFGVTKWPQQGYPFWQTPYLQGPSVPPPAPLSPVPGAPIPGNGNIPVDPGPLRGLPPAFGYPPGTYYPPLQ